MTGRATIYGFRDLPNGNEIWASPAGATEEDDPLPNGDEKQSTCRNTEGGGGGGGSTMPDTATITDAMNNNEGM